MPFACGGLPLIPRHECTDRGGATAQIFEPFRRIEAWRERMRAFGHGSHDDLDSGAAVAIAHAAAPLPSPGMNDDTHGIALGEKVVIAATDKDLADAVESGLFRRALYHRFARRRMSLYARPKRSFQRRRQRWPTRPLLAAMPRFPTIR